MRTRQRRLALRTAIGVAVCAFAGSSVSFAEEQDRRRIEEVVVTAEKREASIQDTSISITAFDGQFLQDFGIRNQEDLANFIPATTIQPYDMAVRGIGRTFRALGGDPGVATYLNGVYSEDFGIASTEGGLFDIERIEVLRGPQGTLYGRNAIGGAVNFISKRPSQEFEGEVQTIFGNNELREYKAVLNGPIIKDILSARINGIKRERGAYFDDVSGNTDPNNYGDENYALSLEFTPTDKLTMYARVNERSYRRRMGAAGQTAGAVVISEGLNQTLRDTTSQAFGFREVFSSNMDAGLVGGIANGEVGLLSNQAGALAALQGSAMANNATMRDRNFVDPNGQFFAFTSQVSGETKIAQMIRPGLDPSPDDEPNRGFNINGVGGTVAPIQDPENLSGDDLNTSTNGIQDEFFDHQAVQFETAYDATDWLTVKYIFGYQDYFYDRTTDRDLTSNPFSDETFYVYQEAEIISHELQFYIDFGERATLTSGLFFYHADITQGGDYFSAATGTSQQGSYLARGEPRYGAPVDYGPLTAIFQGALGTTDLFGAKAANANSIANGNGPLVQNNDANSAIVAGAWAGEGLDANGNPVDNCIAIPNGPATCQSFVEYQTENDTDAFAFYNQAEIFITDKISLTLGLRYAKDEREGEENVYLYVENDPQDVRSGLSPVSQAFGFNDLAAFNIATGALDPNTLQPTGNGTLRLRGVPYGLSFYRPVEGDWSQINYRVNVDWEPNDHTLIYAGTTTGYRSGGFNLANLSNSPVYPEERITAYELGWKDTLLDGTLQINASIYYYDYENIHVSIDGISEQLGNVNNVFAAPEAELFGFEGEILWLATDRLTLGGNWSYTDSEYTQDIVGDITFDFDEDGTAETVTGSLASSTFNPTTPASLFTNPQDISFSIKGNQLQLVPEVKYTVFGIYSYPMERYGTLEFRTNVSYTDEVFFTTLNEDQDKAPDYYRWDARVTWRSPDESLSASFFVNNILDDIGIRQVSRLEENQNYQRAVTPTDPRLMGIELSYRFGAYR